MLLSRGSFNVFVARPISGTLIGLISAFILWQFTVFLMQARKAKAKAPPVAPPHAAD